MHIIMFGAPGSGKGTQAKLLSDALDIDILAVGDLFRNILKDESHPDYEKVKIISSGSLVSDVIVKEVVEAEVSRFIKEGRGIIFDGFPRNKIQMGYLEEILSTFSIKIDKAIRVNVPDDEIVERIMGRYTCAGCGAIYHKKYHPTSKEGICDQCGSKDFSYRTDDNESVVRKRLAIYRESTAPIIEHYKEQELLLDIDGTKVIPEINKGIMKVLKM